MRLFEKIKTVLARLYIFCISLNKKEKRNSFNNFYRESQSVLIVYPGINGKPAGAEEFIRDIAGFPKKITVIAHARHKTVFEGLKNINVVAFNDKDLNFIGLPGKELRGKIAGEKYDLAIDLNTKPEFYSIDCIKTANPKWRVGFYEGKGDKIFNVMIKNSFGESKISYKNLLNCLTMF